MKTDKFVWMRNIITFASIFGLLLAFEVKAQPSDPEKFPEIERQVLQHRAVEAMIWVLPNVERFN